MKHKVLFGASKRHVMHKMKYQASFLARGTEKSASLLDFA